MSVHCYDKWTLDDPIEACPIERIAGCIQYHGFNNPPVYGIWTVGDSFIYNVTGFINKHTKRLVIDEAKGTEQVHGDNPSLTRELIEAELEPNAPQRDVIIEVFVRVLKELKLFEQQIPVKTHKIPNFSGLKTLSIPKINKPFPEL